MPSSWSTMPLLEPIAWKEFLGLWHDEDPSVLLDLVMEYLTDARRHQELMLGAISSADARALEFSAHFLKSSSGNLGAARMQEICRALQDLGREKSLSVAAEYLRHFEIILGQTQDALVAELPELASRT